MSYALIENHIVINTIVWDGEAPITFPDGVVAAYLPDGSPVSIGYAAEQDESGEWVFTAPPQPPTPPPTPAEILAANTSMRNQLLAAATLAIAPLQDAIDIGEATADDVAMLTAWKTFRVAVNRVVLTVQNPTWPTPPQPGYGTSIAPPVSSS